MGLGRYAISCCVVLSILGCWLRAQVQAGQSSALVPQLVNFSGKATDGQGQPIAGIVGITFSIYKDQYEGAPLWMEVQNVQADANGNYTVQLGASRAQGAVIKNPAILTSTLGHFFGAFWSCRSAAISTLESRISPMRAVQAVRGGSR